jgi:hypothetical protein
MVGWRYACPGYRLFIFLHYWLEATSSNLDDPKIKPDPMKNIFSIIYKE